LSNNQQNEIEKVDLDFHQRALQINFCKALLCGKDGLGKQS